jgi:hypothetical protein
MPDDRNIMDLEVGLSPTGAELSRIAAKLQAIGPVGFQFAIVLHAIAAKLEHTASTARVAEILIQAGKNLSRFNAQIIDGG